MNNTLPEVIDLFSGCGGLALGFQKEGFDITHGIEINREAVETASYNLHWRYGRESGHICTDITETGIDVFKNDIGRNGCIVIGGPPCQAYSIAGRAKLKSLGEDRKNINDRRGYLYQDFLRFAIGLDARAVVMENVPEATNYGGKNIPHIVCESLCEHGYDAYWTILNAADYGVPQVRERIFVIAIKKNENKPVCLPEPTNSSFDPRKTQGELRVNSFSESEYFMAPKKGDNGCMDRWITVGDAISNLPVLFPFSHSKYVLNRMNTSIDYQCDYQNDYQKSMREWYGFDIGAVTGNCFRKTERDFPIFAEMKQGDDYVSASRIADTFLEQAVKARGVSMSEDGAAYKKLKKEIVPPYDRDNFKSKWQRLREDSPSHTLVAHLSVDTYSHIHPTEPRGISVREAARLQSFPDGFLFQCTMGDAFKQIGNAVPPLLACGLAKQIKKAFSKEGNKDD